MLLLLLLFGHELCPTKTLVAPLTESHYPKGFGELNLTTIDFSYCKQLDLSVIFDTIFKFKGLTNLGLSGLEMESLPEGKQPRPPGTFVFY